LRNDGMKSGSQTGRARFARAKTEGQASVRVLGLKALASYPMLQVCDAQRSRDAGKFMGRMKKFGYQVINGRPCPNLGLARFAVQRILTSAAFRDVAALLGRFLPN